MKQSEFDKEYLPLLMEECSEVVQAAAKCQRFGLKDCNPDLGPSVAASNDVIMLIEIGDILGVLDAAFPEWWQSSIIRQARQNKTDKLEVYGPYGSYTQKLKQSQ